MKKIEADLFEHVQFLSALQCSAKGTPAWVSTEVRDDRYIAHLMMLRDGKAEILTSFDEKLFAWENEDTILFVSDRDQDSKDLFEERTDFYRIRVNGSEAARAFRIPMNVTRFVPLQDGRILMQGRISLDHPDYYLKSKQEQEQIHLARKKESAVQIIDEQPYYQDGAGFTNGLRNQLFLYDEKTGSVTALFKGRENVSSFVLSEDQKHLAVIVSDFKQVRTRRESLVLFDLSDLNCRTLIEEGHYSLQEAYFTSEGDLLVAMSDMKRFGLVENPWLYRLDTVSGQLQCLWRNELTVGSSIGSDCQYGSGKQSVMSERGLMMICTRGYQDELICLDGQGKMESLYRFDGAVQSMAYAEDQVYVIAMIGQKLQELYCLDLKTGKLVQISHLNEHVLDDTYVAVPEMLTIPAGDTTVEGWVLKPAEYDPKKRYPAILDIHGGPKMTYGTTFFHEMQYWASQGYFVFYCNPRGSDGKDNVFADLRGLYGTIDYDDLMNFTNEVLKCYPAIDEKRIGVTGGSYGGFMTNWMIGHTDRFAAAASQRSIANWVSLICYADIGCTFDMDQVDGDPWNDHQKVWDQSPLQYADRARTPTLFIHSFEDYRCLLQEGMQMYNALVYHGVPARMCLFKGESHGLSRIGKPSNRQRRILEITAWMDRYCKV